MPIKLTERKIVEEVTEINTVADLVGYLTTATIYAPNDWIVFVASYDGVERGMLGIVRSVDSDGDVVVSTFDEAGDVQRGFYVTSSYLGHIAKVSPTMLEEIKGEPVPLPDAVVKAIAGQAA